MPDPLSSQPAPEPATSSSPNLPVPVPQHIHTRGNGEGFFARIVRTLFGWKSGPTRADLAVVLEAAVPGETGVTPEERTMMQNILALRGRRIEDVMVPRSDIIAVQQDIALGELLKVFEGAEHSRLAVYNDTLDDPAGMVHIRDLIAYMVEHAQEAARNSKRKKPLPTGLDLKAINLALPLSSTGIVRPLLFVPPSMPAIDLLAKMQATRIHLALVVDEYGGTDGLVSIEDLVEQIVGDIADEHDADVAPYVVRQPDGSFIADARASLEDVVAAVGPEFDVGEAGEDVDTLAGYLMTRSGRLPLRGELVPGPADFEIEVLDADPRRIKKVRIHRALNRLIERDRDGRRRYRVDSTVPAVTMSPVPDSSSAPPPAPAPGQTTRRS